MRETSGSSMNPTGRRVHHQCVVLRAQNDDSWKTASVSRFDSNEALVADAATARLKLEGLLADLPGTAKVVEVTDGMNVKDFIAHRTEWGRMMLDWYGEAKAGSEPAVPAPGYTWGQLPELNAEIHDRFADAALADVERDFASVHNELFGVMEACSDDELFTKRYYSFTGTSDLATYFTSATGGHYRSAYKHINRWWRANRLDYLDE
jgi:hypothetical protein